MPQHTLVATSLLAGCTFWLVQGFLNDLALRRPSFLPGPRPATTRSVHVSSATHSVTTSTATTTDALPWPLDTDAYGEFDQEDYAWCYTTVPNDAVGSYECTDIEGMLPPETLGGRFLRIGPGNFERGGQRYNHILDGDGFVVSFNFTMDGRVYYNGRFVETEYFAAEQQADQILFRNVFGTQRDGGVLSNVFDVNLKNTANTNVLYWDDRLFALWEAGRPYELDPETLGALPYRPNENGPFQNLGKGYALRGMTLDQGGPIDEAMGLGRSFTAHPHHVGNDTIVVFKAGQELFGDNLKMEFLEIDADWQTVQSVPYVCEGAPSGPHDYGLSTNYYYFFQNRFEMDTLPFVLGFKSPSEILQVPMQEPNILHLVARDPGKKSLQLDIPSYFMIHSIPLANEKDSILYIYSNGWDLKDERYFDNSQTSVPFLGSSGGRCPDFKNGIVPPALLYRTVVDLNAERVLSHTEVIPGLVMEFPTQDPIDPHIIYFPVASTDYSSLPGTGIGKVNTETNKAEYWWAENHVFTSEVTPVPKRDRLGCWLIGLLYNADEKRVVLAVFDSEQLERGPVCEVHLPHALSYLLHGCFVPSQTLQS